MKVQQSYNQNVLLTIQTTLSQYPILTDKIVGEMYNRLIRDGYISFNSFSERVRDFALLTQKREGLQNPFAQEAPHIWEARLSRVRQSLVIQEFAHRYTFDDFSAIVDYVLQDKIDEKQPVIMWHNLQSVTLETIFEQALAIERMPISEQKKYEAQLMGAKVTLIRRLITDRVPFINVAKNVFSIHDLVEIDRLRIGRGRIGSKAAGILLANRILHSANDADIRNCVGKIETICIGCDEFYNFLMINDLLMWSDQKYKDEETLWSEYPILQAEFAKGEMPQDIVNSLRRLLEEFDGSPFIVRSSSILEDSFVHPFNSMYESYFIPNQGLPEDTLKDLLDAIRKIYASGFNPNALTYRKKNALLDYDERLGIVIQRVPGNVIGSYYFPDISGIGSGISPYKWQQNSHKDEGFLRFVIGIGTRATNRNGDDYSHVIELAEPDVRHSSFTAEEKFLGQENISVLDLNSNTRETMDVHDVLSSSYAPFYLIAQQRDGDSMRSLRRGEECDNFTVTCRDLVRKTDFTRLMRDILKTLEKTYKKPVMVDFAAMIDVSDPRSPRFHIQIHNCRPALIPPSMTTVCPHPDVPVKRELFTSDLFSKNGLISDIDYVVFVDPERYRRVQGKDKETFCNLLSEINKKMARERFVFAAASRWGTSENHGIPVHYREISNALAIIELSGWDPKHISDPFAGTQLFQSIQEAGIYAIITNADKPEDIDHSFFTDSADRSCEWVEIPEKFRNTVRILSTRGWYGSRSLMIDMNSAEGITRASFV